jgi:hypothetical protein
MLGCAIRVGSTCSFGSSGICSQPRPIRFVPSLRLRAQWVTIVPVVNQVCSGVQSRSLSAKSRPGASHAKPRATEIAKALWHWLGVGSGRLSYLLNPRRDRRNIFACIHIGVLRLPTEYPPLEEWSQLCGAKMLEDRSKGDGNAAAS